MSLTDEISGTAYVGSIKDPKDPQGIHKRRDLLHAVIYEDPNDNFLFNDLRVLIHDCNGLQLYTHLVDPKNIVKMCNNIICIMHNNIN